MDLSSAEYSVRMIALHRSLWWVSHVTRTWWWHLRNKLTNNDSNISITLFIGLLVLHTTQTCTISTTDLRCGLIWVYAILFLTLKWSQCGTFSADTNSCTSNFLSCFMGKIVSKSIVIFFTTCIRFGLHSLLSRLINFFRFYHCSRISGTSINAALLHLHLLMDFNINNLNLYLDLQK